jgi:hypothetical protein
MEEDRSALKIVTAKPKGNIPVGIPRSIWKTISGWILKEKESIPGIGLI